MGLVKLPSIYDYWQKGKVFHYSAVASRISRKRFFELHWYLHFVDNDMLPQPGQDNYDKLGKVRLIINILTSNFSATYEFGRDVSIDQAMIPLDAKVIYAKKKKTVKQGIKIWMAADASSGCDNNLDVYTGRKGDNTEKGLGGSVVKSLTAALHHSYCHIFFDNFFCKPTAWPTSIWTLRVRKTGNQWEGLSPRVAKENKERPSKQRWLYHLSM